MEWPGAHPAAESLCAKHAQRSAAADAQRRPRQANGSHVPSRNGNGKCLFFWEHPVRNAGLGGSQYALSCTACTARPDGSTMFFRLASHSSAAGVEQATDGPPGTHSAAQACG